jgi:two-component system, sensor histidine kinase and response regulator
MPKTDDNGTSKGDILVVDDNPANLRLLSGMLSERGYKARPVIDGTMALTAARAAPPDLILLDINMPDMDGYQVCRTLKENAQLRDVPVIFISAMDEIDDKVRAFEAGGVDYVAKPFQFQEVVARVENHLALKHLQHALEATNRELEVRIEELQARNEELDAFAHTVAHDLKNPLSAIIGYSTLLESRRDQLSEENLAAFITNISQNGQRMNNIIKELLLLSSVRKTEEIEVQPLDMGAIIEGVQERLADMIDEYAVQIEVPASWPQALGRAQWVEEIWANYISNAIKYGGRPPHVTLGGDAPAGGAVRFWVRDNGEGLTAEEQAQLFAPFERLHQVKAEGHGLGLSIVRRIVDKLGGTVGVESEVGHGACFTFSLPPAAS